MAATAPLAMKRSGQVSLSTSTHAAPNPVRPRLGRTEAGEGASVFEETRPVVDVQRVRLTPEVCHEQVLVPVEVDVNGIHAHAGLGHAVGVDCRARQRSGIGQGTVAPVQPQVVLLAVVGDVDVHPPVAVEVGGDHAERGTRAGVPAARRCCSHHRRCRRPGFDRAGPIAEGRPAAHSIPAHLPRSCTSSGCRHHAPRSCRHTDPATRRGRSRRKRPTPPIRESVPLWRETSVKLPSPLLRRSWFGP